MGAELVAPTVTMTTSGPALCDCGRLGVVAVDCAHPRGRACDGSVPVRKEALALMRGSLLPPHSGTITAVTGHGITVHVTPKQTCWP